MTAIYLIRHGQASFGKQNYDCLSQTGEQQALRLGESLKSRIGHFDKVILGGMLRHHQTATLCLKSMAGFPTEEQWTVDPRWNEYDHVSILTCFNEQFATPQGIGQFVRQQKDPNAAFEQLFNDAMQRWMSGQYHGYSESWQQYLDRVSSALNQTLTAYPEARNIAVFTSGGPISVVSQSLLGIAPERIMQLNWTLLNAAVTKLVKTHNRLFLASLNEHSHFEGDYQRLLTYK